MSCYGALKTPACAGTVNEQEILRQSLHELLIDPLLGSAMPSQVSATRCCHTELV